MRRATKIGGGILVVVVLAAIAIGAVLLSRADRYIIAAVERYGEAATGTSVSVDSADISLSQRRGTLNGLTIANPEGFDGNALRIDEVGIRLDLASLTGGTLVVNSVNVDGARLNAVQRGTRSNLTELLERMQQDTGQPPPEAADQQPGRIIIDRFSLTGGQLHLTSDRLESPQMLELDDVVVRDIGRGTDGATYPEATDAILGAMLQAARTAVTQRLEQAAGEAAERELEEEIRDQLGGDGN